MAEQYSDINAIAALFSDYNIRLKNLEEKNSMIREAVNLLGDNLINFKNSLNNEINLINKDLREIRIELNKIKETTLHIIQESSDFARKTELESLQKYIKLWEPLKFVKEEQVREIVKEEMKRKK